MRDASQSFVQCMFSKGACFTTPVDECASKAHSLLRGCLGVGLLDPEAPLEVLLGVARYVAPLCSVCMTFISFCCLDAPCVALFQR